MTDTEAFDTLDKKIRQRVAEHNLGDMSFPRNFVFQEMGYNAPDIWKEK
jgi:hypothetical protein